MLEPLVIQNKIIDIFCNKKKYVFNQKLKNDFIFFLLQNYDYNLIIGILNYLKIKISYLIFLMNYMFNIILI